jgi:hypothetical protein
MKTKIIFIALLFFSLVVNSQTNYYVATSANGGSNSNNGSIDQVGIWNKVLTSTEVAELYNIWNP